MAPSGREAEALGVDTMRAPRAAAIAGIVAGARVPIILTSRADSVQTRLASCAVAALLAAALRSGVAGGKDGGEAS